MRVCQIDGFELSIKRDIKLVSWRPPLHTSSTALSDQDEEEEEDKTRPLLPSLFSSTSKVFIKTEY